LRLESLDQLRFRAETLAISEDPICKRSEKTCDASPKFGAREHHGEADRDLNETVGSTACSVASHSSSVTTPLRAVVYRPGGPHVVILRSRDDVRKLLPQSGKTPIGGGNQREAQGFSLVDYLCPWGSTVKMCAPDPHPKRLSVNCLALGMPVAIPPLSPGCPHCELRPSRDLARQALPLYGSR
jgi:hypothetical protein